MVNVLSPKQLKEVLRDYEDVLQMEDKVAIILNAFLVVSEREQLLPLIPILRNNQRLVEEMLLETGWQVEFSKDDFKIWM